MNRNEAFQFVNEHQPFPLDVDFTDELLDQLRAFVDFMETCQDKTFINPTLGALASNDVLYERKSMLCGALARNFTPADLEPALLANLLSASRDAKQSALEVISYCDGPLLKAEVQQILESTDDQELVVWARRALENQLTRSDVAWIKRAIKRAIREEKKAELETLLSIASS